MKRYFFIKWQDNKRLLWLLCGRSGIELLRDTGVISHRGSLLVNRLYLAENYVPLRLRHTLPCLLSLL
ncbi:protein of unknown function [Desulfovibrio sp. 86]|nr:protein of unknown function [Desulfovibrio sp. 86]